MRKMHVTPVHARANVSCDPSPGGPWRAGARRPYYPPRKAEPDATSCPLQCRKAMQVPIPRVTLRSLQGQLAVAGWRWPIPVTFPSRSQPSWTSVPTFMHHNVLCTHRNAHVAFCRPAVPKTPFMPPVSPPGACPYAGRWDRRTTPQLNSEQVPLATRAGRPRGSWWPVHDKARPCQL